MTEFHVCFIGIITYLGNKIKVQRLNVAQTAKEKA